MDAAAAVRGLAEALARDPGSLPLRIRLAQARKAAGDVNGAVAELASAVKASPASAEAWLALAGLLMEIELATPAGRTRGGTPPLVHALAAFDEALARAPEAPGAIAPAAMAHAYACDWPRAEALAAKLVAIGRASAAPFPVSPVMAAALIGDAALQRRAIADFAAAALPPPAPRPPRAPAAIRERGSRLRVGYLSADFHEHATAHLAAGLFERHDRTRVATFAYSLDRDDGGPMRARLRRAFGTWRDLAGADDGEAAGEIAADRLDVLVDLKGHTQGGRLGILATRPAPAQIHYLGFPGTLAWGAIDALVADAIVVPQGEERHYAETVLRLPRCYQVNDRGRPRPPAPSRASVGLPEHGLVLASFNQGYKLARPYVEIWLDALARHGDAVLWLYVPHLPARENLRAAAAARGVAPERIVFAPHARQVDHLARLACADLALDVLPYGSHTTGSDALWCGVPLLTHTGTTFAGRVGTSLVDAVGLPELAVASLDAYRTALETLASRRERLADLRRHLERGRLDFPLFDTEGFARDFERLLEDAANGGAAAR
jgi:predicted O-linked N-acetylglucosamine transferase (SPINDLY family)